MNEMKNRKVIHIILLLIIIFLYVVLYTDFFKYAYGSSVDWDVQHWIIPDLLRKNFYKTGNIIPNFLFNIGGGQNIFNFAYYGFLSPMVLLSFFLPFVNMQTYISVFSILNISVSVCLVYFFILKKIENNKIAFLSSLVFLLMSPVLFQTHRHIMFVNYFPFIILSFFGVDSFFEKGNYCLLSFSIFLLILTSYFFSIPSIMCVIIYALSVYFKDNAFFLKKFLNDGIHFLLPIILGISMSSFFLLPVFSTLLSGRSSSNFSMNFLNLIIPNFSLNEIFYSNYSVGLSLFVLLPIFYFLFAYKKRKDCFVISLFLFLLFVFPLFSYVLNGTMYINYKVLIPFCPIVVYLFSLFFKTIVDFADFHKKNLYISLLFFIVVLVLNIHSSFFYILLFDFIVTILFVFLNIKSFKKSYYFFVILSFLLIAFSSQINDKKVLRNYFQKVESSYENFDFSQQSEVYRSSAFSNYLLNSNYIYNSEVNKVSIYSSVSNNLYKDFYYLYSGNEISQRSYGKIVDSTNVFFNSFMGVKYIISNENIEPFYSKVSGSYYINNNALPLIFSNRNVLSLSDFYNLKFPYNMDAYLNYVIVDEKNYNGDLSTFNSYIEEFDPLFVENEILKKYKFDSDLSFILNENTNIELEMSNWGKDEILMISFDIEENNCPIDLSITINGVKNLVSCSSWKYYNKNNSFNYVLIPSSNKLSILFSAGEFHISNIKFYKILIDKFNYNSSSFDKGIVNLNGDVINAKIDVTDDGYIVTSIPFDNGFYITLDGEKVEYEIVNTAFIGFKVSKGFHNITIEYNTPFLKEGIVISTISFISFFVLLYLRKEKIKKA